jgi:MFS family permease
VARTVWLLGLVSLFTDVSSEMVATILPVYVFYSLGASTLQFGVLDGLYQGSAALVRIAGGMIADRRTAHKQVAVTGYGLSAFCKPALLAVGSSLGALSAVLVVDRAGKGIRTAPRDAMISLSSRRESLGLAFGVHRALDTAGAMIGPLIAVGLLLLAPGRYDTVFVVSFGFALIGLAILVLLVPGRFSARRSRAPKTATRAQPRRRRSLRLKPADRQSLRVLMKNARFRVLVACGVVLGLVTLSDAFLYLGIQQQMNFTPPLLPLLYVGTNFAYMSLAIPVGKLSDRIGRGKVFIAGYALLALVYTSLMLQSIGVWELAIFLLLFGAFYAATDGVLAALASSVLPEELRATGLSVLAAASAVAGMVSSVAFGALWTVYGIETAVHVFAVGLLAAAVLAGIALGARGLVAQHD